MLSMVRERAKHYEASKRRIVHLQGMNDREFRQHLVEKRLERQRKAAQAANTARKPPGSERVRKIKRTRFA